MSAAHNVMTLTYAPSAMIRMVSRVAVPATAAPAIVFACAGLLISALALLSGADLGGVLGAIE